ncbi:hypothetical protein SOVF_207470, partial [Spinacia oleracea]
MSAYSATKRKTVHPPLSRFKDWQDRFYFVQVPDNFLLRRTFTKPRPRMEQYNQRGLGRRERKAFDYLECDILDVGLSKKQAVNRNWLPNAYYILGSQPLSAVGLCNTHCFGTKTLDRELLGFDENWRPVCTQPPQPKAKYDTISTYSTRASSRRSTTTVAKNRVSAACKSKSSFVVVSQAPPSSTMQSNRTGR